MTARSVTSKYLNPKPLISCGRKDSQHLEVLHSLTKTLQNSVGREINELPHHQGLAMKVNIYAEELTDRVEMTAKKPFVGISFYLELPASFVDGRPATREDTVPATQMRAPFIHRPGDDDSAAVTFWATDRERLRALLKNALAVLDGRTN